MKTYFRLLSFAKPIEKFAIPYIFATLLAILFNTLNFSLLAPLLQTLFSVDKNAGKTPILPPDSNWDIMGNFNYYVQKALIEYGGWETLKIVCIIIIVSVFLSNLFRYFSQRIMENLRVHTLLNLRKTVFNNVMNLHLGYFSNERKGDIMSKVSTDVQVVQFTVTSTLQVVFKEPAQLIAYLVMLFNISFSLTLYSLIIIPIAGLIIARIVKKLKHQAVAASETFANMISFLEEALGGVKIIKAFNATEYIKNRFNQENVKYSSITRSMAKRQQLASPVSEFLGVLMVVGIVLYGGYLVLNKQSELAGPAFITYIAIFSQIMRPAKAISDSFSNIHNGIAAGNRVLDLIDVKPAIVNKNNALNIHSFNDNLTFKNVSFGYGDKQVLQNINLTIPKGKIVALVGPSGGGKSTMIDLISRFYDPSAGEVLIDGKNLKDITIESLRQQMGTVSQESILFNDTIFNNIAFSKPEASMEEVVAAAKIANAHEFILHTANGYETNIGDRGNRLSGGQKQRLCIARAVLANPPIMLLDEATSALDTESEKLVQDALNKLMLNRTSIVIAHRLSTIQHADIIVVIEKGMIVETGNHSTLMNHDGLYKRLIDMQAFDKLEIKRFAKE
ncbi:MAG TPA: ABC transporter ATP-binding protein [Daejeonella sp.]|nr:ABC transporter ATP-binding protein [Daejeonella sp.]